MLLLGLVLSGFLSQAQKNYAVMVIDAKTGNPITTASIKIKSTGMVVPISLSGNALIVATAADTLQIHSKGYGDREIILAGQSSAISIVMQPKVDKKPVAAKAKKNY